MVLVPSILKLAYRSIADRCCVACLLACVCVALTLPAPMMAQQPPGWQWQNPLPQGNTINSIRFTADKQNGWAIGSDGVILRTRNGGFEWQTQISQANTTLYGLYVKDKSRVVISGARGVILTTSNGGKRWVERITGTRDHLFSV